MASLYLVTCPLFAGLALYVVMRRELDVSESIGLVYLSFASRLPFGVIEKSKSWQALERFIVEMNPESAFAHRGKELLCIVCGAPVIPSLVVAIFMGPLVGAIGLVLMYIAIYLFGLVQEKAFQEARAQALPQVARSLASTLGSGQTLSQAIDYVANNTSGACTSDFVRASMHMRCGASAEEALSELAESLQVPGAEMLGNILLISHQTGAPLRNLLLRCAKLLENKSECERTLKVKTAQARLSVQVVCVLPLILVCLLALISPDFQTGLRQPLGVACELVALALDACALFIIHRLMKRALR